MVNQVFPFSPEPFISVGGGCGIPCYLSGPYRTQASRLVPAADRTLQFAPLTVLQISLPLPEGLPGAVTGRVTAFLKAAVDS